MEFIGCIGFSGFFNGLFSGSGPERVTCLLRGVGLGDVKTYESVLEARLSLVGGPYKQKQRTPTKTRGLAQILEGGAAPHAPCGGPR